MGLKHTYHPIFIILKIYFFFLLRFVACGILVPQPGIKPMPPAVGVWSLNHWTTREVPITLFLEYFHVQLSPCLPAASCVPTSTARCLCPGQAQLMLVILV